MGQVFLLRDVIQIGASRKYSMSISRLVQYSVFWLGTWDSLPDGGRSGGGRAYGPRRGLGWAFPGERGRKATEFFRVLTEFLGGHVSKYAPWSPSDTVECRNRLKRRCDQEVGT